jgi:branched-chain amino acid transport system substrate-binding protein
LLGLSTFQPVERSGLSSRASVPVGIVFSTTGAYAAIGREALDGALLALDTINADDRFDFRFDVAIADPAGIADRYPVDADRQLCERGCRHILGGITSWSRKELIPVIERRSALLWYAFPYEGYESNDHVIYLGACPNQHIVPLLDHVVPLLGSRPFLVGSNYIWGWEIARIAGELVAAKGGQACGQRFIPLGSTDVAGTIAEIKQARPDFVLSNLLGPSASAFIEAYAELARAEPGFRPQIRPLVSCNLTEADLAGVGDAAIGHLATAVYFDTLDSPGAAALRRAASRQRANRPLTSCFASSYAALMILADCIREAGTDQPDAVRSVATRRSFATPLGPIAIDPRNQHAALTPHIGRVVSGQRFEVVASAPEPLAPDPYLAMVNRAHGADNVLRPTPFAHLRVVS